jgi:hypothetical protein
VGELIESELAGHDLGASGYEPAARHDLDHVDPPLGSLANRRTKLGSSLHLAADDCPAAGNRAWDRQPTAACHSSMIATG